ncbi:FKBP-type peptidyl-prolyl cis-trans isomerase [Eudoraea chungangensis]|uniref:FKBP-type peptidyl-prolyl cis-trans isomerase n=1 Tax=Eudoraea chungangensis TaxID=1481905 RepID=UPI0023EDBA47|nr:hypothetical protein [Eudoraea chungangensis]
MKERVALVFTLVLMFAQSCSDDDDNTIPVVPPRPMAEVEAENDADIREYLETHYYNYEEFQNPPAGFDYKIVLDTLIKGDGNIPMIEQVSSVNLAVESSFFNLEEDVTVDHTLYYLSARDGVGGSPTIADSTFTSYEGSLLNGLVFDGSTTYSWQYLPFFLRGYAVGVTKFNVGENVATFPDGTFEIEGSGVGLIFIPSGLAYFNNPPIGSGIDLYDPLIFQVNTGLYEENTDYDNDGIPSIMEDLNNDGILANDNTDLEQERTTGFSFLPNHIDSDDDQDGTPTRDEIIIDANGTITFPDTDGDGIPDYLDRDNS